MKYKNLRTGNVINVKSGFSSKEWVPVQAPISDKPGKHKVAPVQQAAKPKRSNRKKKAEEVFDDEEE